MGQQWQNQKEWTNSKESLDLAFKLKYGMYDEKHIFCFPTPLYLLAR
jgi:hypothetical protein